MAIHPPGERLWWNHRVDGVELTWIAVAFTWGLVMFFMMIYWHATGRQNLSTETYRTTPNAFYAKVENKPMLALLHGVIGIQHASMAIYNAYCDRVPIFMIAGLDIEGAVPAHNAVDMAALARDYVKWDHQPDNLNQFTNSMFRAYKLMMTPPMSPVLIVADSRIQKDALTRRPNLPKLVMPAPPAADTNSPSEPPSAHHPPSSSACFSPKAPSSASPEVSADSPSPPPEPDSSCGSPPTASSSRRAPSSAPAATSSATCSSSRTRAATSRCSPARSGRS